MKSKILSMAVAVLAIPSLTCCIEEYEPQKSFVTIDQAADAPGSFDNFVKSLTSSLGGEFTYSGSSQYPFDFGYTSFFLQRDVMGQDIALANDGSWFSYWYTCSQTLGPTYAVCQLPWTYYYGWIKNCNTVIEMGGEVPTDDKKSGVGLAYAMRAMFYLDIVRMYAPETYAKNLEALTVPKVTEDKSIDPAHNARMTNKEAFEFILSDLDKAEEYLKDYVRDDIYTPDLSVVYGLKARAYLTMEDWANAAKYAKLAQVGYQEMTGSEWTSRTNGFNSPNGAWMFAYKFKSTDPNLRDNDGDSSWASQMIIEMSPETNGCGYAANYGYPLVIDRHLYETIPSSDYRKGVFVDFGIDELPSKEDMVNALSAYSDHPEWIYNCGIECATTYGQVGGLEVKFRPVNGDGTKPLAEAGAVSVPLMRVEEMKLIEIEAVGMQNEAEGKALLEQFAKARDPQYVYGTHNEAYGNRTTSAFQNEVWWQRRVELWGEGFATFDIKRLDKGIIRNYAGTNHFEGYLWNMDKTPDWMTLCIIATEADYNYDLVNNPAPIAPSEDSQEHVW
ncbi:MAG: RagB/SusD family nutrient uptake outer membrane protein [Prevotella sp.]